MENIYFEAELSQYSQYSYLFTSGVKRLCCNLLQCFPSRSLLFNHHIINSPPWVLATLPLSLPGSVWVFPSFRPIPSLSSPLSLMQGKCLLLFPGKKKGKKYQTRLVPTTFYTTQRGEGMDIVLCGDGC